ncbi:MAG TPA: sigma-70 family RNA polymerase sigma factor [Phycisphaerae bacterium]|nr:sigma-70 family RNA polymerase sigma factor [Phycisphaerae bacterium]HRW51788.1 sigma-70 family RNA polymerase sigma factor [Phycisphaerae bacterium]
MDEVQKIQITQILGELSDGERSAAERLVPFVYKELRALAGSYLRNARANHTLQPTALVHEAYLRLVRSDAGWSSRKHFFDVAAMAMRQLLTDHARRRATKKRGGKAQQMSLTLSDVPSDVMAEVDLIALDEALTRLSELDPRQARIVELRYLAGLSIEETADVLETSPRTVTREWRVARAWLRTQLSED